MATAEERGITTIRVERSLHARLKEMRPYDSMSWNEFIEELADEYADNS
jgi:predicted DNA-binding ribbon-helix-helix protein